MREYKKYPNRRLYDIEESKYVTVEDIRKVIPLRWVPSLSLVKTPKKIKNTQPNRYGRALTANLWLIDIDPSQARTKSAGDANCPTCMAKLALNRR